MEKNGRHSLHRVRTSGRSALSDTNQTGGYGKSRVCIVPERIASEAYACGSFRAVTGKHPGRRLKEAASYDLSDHPIAVSPR